MDTAPEEIAQSALMWTALYAGDVGDEDTAILALLLASTPADPDSDND